MALTIFLADRQPPPERSLEPLPESVVVLDESAECAGDRHCFRTAIVTDRSRAPAPMLVDSLAAHFLEHDRNLVRTDTGCWIGDLEICPSDDPRFPDDVVAITATREVWD